MTKVMVATGSGCRMFGDEGEEKTELPGKSVWALASDLGGMILAIVQGQEIWRRTASGDWSLVITLDSQFISMAPLDQGIILGSMTDAYLVRVSPDKKIERLSGFDQTANRSQWFQQGPPLHVRSLSCTSDQTTILAAVHVGGISRSTDSGRSWQATIPIDYDVHEVRAHHSKPIIAAATAVGLCISKNNGINWSLITSGIEKAESKDSLALAVLENEVIFSLQNGGPFAKRSQIWKWKIDSDQVEQVQGGLPQWFDGRVDTSHISSNGQAAAVLDGGGNLWFAKKDLSGWARLANGLEGSMGIQILRETE